LRRLHIDTLDLVVASHNHSDHIGGLPVIFDSVPVRHFIDNGRKAPTAIYEAVIRGLELHRIDVLNATPRDLQLGSVSLRILPTDPDATTQNNSSVGILLIYGTFTALFTGDAEDPARDYWREHAALPQVTVLKVAHHGAFNGTDPAWEVVTSPCYAVISVGANDYGHPARETIGTLIHGGAVVYRTDRDSTVEVDISLNGQLSIQALRPAGEATVHSGAAPASCPAVVH
jgi:beta-lactamase superfamily II metal-dependent hydrolase